MRMNDEGGRGKRDRRRKKSQGMVTKTLDPKAGTCRGRDTIQCRSKLYTPYHEDLAFSTSSR